MVALSVKPISIYGHALKISINLNVLITTIKYQLKNLKVLLRMIIEGSILTISNLCLKQILVS